MSDDRAPQVDGAPAFDFSEALDPTPRKRKSGPRGPRKSKAIKLSREDIFSTLYTLGGTLNGIVKSLPRKAEAAINWADDALDEEELQAFIGALTDSLESNQRALALLAKANKITPHVALLNVTFVILLRRLTRRGIINVEVIDALTREHQPPVHMETGGAPSDPWGHGNGQNGSRFEDISAQDVYARA